ncbi:hypothetical protein EP01_10140 [Bdellovibrio bacteriovorus]|nr:hypothetical protein EP01_10140 [Bdellovibrio bacteriovorus]
MGWQNSVLPRKGVTPFRPGAGAAISSGRPGLPLYAERATGAFTAKPIALFESCYPEDVAMPEASFLVSMLSDFFKEKWMG